jgi:hypothetical protein
MSNVSDKWPSSTPAKFSVPHIFEVLKQPVCCGKNGSFLMIHFPLVGCIVSVACQVFNKEKKIVFTEAQ